MTLWKNYLVVAIGALALSVTACSDDDDDDTGGGSSSSSSSSSSSGGATPTPSPTGGSSSSSSSSSGGGTDLCTDADVAIIDGGTVDVVGEATTCGLGCISAADPIECAQPCVAEETGLTSECSFCYAQLIDCSVANCVSQCVAGFTPECQQCQTDAGCFDVFYPCTGTSPPEATATPTASADPSEG